MTDAGVSPALDELVEDLRRVRESGLGALRRLSIPALEKAAVLADQAENGVVEPAALESLIRLAVNTLGGGVEEDATEALFGLALGTKLRPSVDRRRIAATMMEKSPETFRKSYERVFTEQLAEGVLAVCRDARMRQANSAMRQRHPADSRLAVAWVERFEAYYRLWTPIYALGAGLEAAVTTYRDHARDHLPWDPGTPYEWDPANEAQSYAADALYRYTQFLLELKRFKTARGGMWMFSDVETEEKVMDTVYRIGWHNSINADDDSWLRRHLADSRHEEMEHFKRVILATHDGQQIHAIWQGDVLRCECADLETSDEHCQIHATIRATREYCKLIDKDWFRIADWYRPDSSPKSGIEANTLYSEVMISARTKANTSSIGYFTIDNERH